MGRALDDDVKVSVLLRNAPEAIRRQLQLNAEREGYTFEALYRHITGTRIDLLVDVFGGEADDKFQCASYGMNS